jgi:hypothetical protein
MGNKMVLPLWATMSGSQPGKVQRRTTLMPGAACVNFLPPFGDADCVRHLMLGAAAIVLGFSFLGFFFSRLLPYSPLAIARPFGPEWANDHISTAGQNPVRHSGIDDG